MKNIFKSQKLAQRHRVIGTHIFLPQVKTKVVLKFEHDRIYEE